jgi:hypothetical protein
MNYLSLHREDDIACAMHIHIHMLAPHHTEIQQALPRMCRPATLSLLVYTSLHDLLPALDPFQPPFLPLDLAQGERRSLSELE